MDFTESNGMFKYKPGALSIGDDSKLGSIGLEKEEKSNYFKPSMINNTGPSTPPTATSLPPPLVPSVSVQKGPPPPTIQQIAPQPNHTDSSVDEFLDPELDLDLDGINLDGDAGVSAI